MHTANEFGFAQIVKLNMTVRKAYLPFLSNEHFKNIYTRELGAIHN